MAEQPTRKTIFNRPLKKWEIVLVYCGALAIVALLTPWAECEKYQKISIPLLWMIFFLLAMLTASKYSQGKKDIAMKLFIAATIIMCAICVVTGPSLQQQIQQQMQHDNTARQLNGLRHGNDTSIRATERQNQ